MTQKQDTLRLFFEDPNLEISLRGYGRQMNYGNSKGPRIIKELIKQNYLTKIGYHKYTFYKLNTTNPEVKTLAQLYWQKKLAPLMKKIKDQASPEGIVLVKEIADLTNTKTTPITLLLFKATTNKIPLRDEIKQFGRSIKLIKIHKFSSLPLSYKDITLNGLTLFGKIK